jgi:excisionase family DNA binding protein
MDRQIKFERRRTSDFALGTSPVALADRIELFGSAMTAKQLSALLAVSTIIIYKLAKAGRLPCFKIGTSVRFCPISLSDRAMVLAIA